MLCEDGARIHEPYFSHSFCNDVHVLLGFTSNMFPNNGMPGGCGIGVAIVMPAARLIEKVMVQQKIRWVLRRLKGGLQGCCMHQDEFGLIR